MTSSLLEINALSWRVGNKQILNNLNLTVKQGEFTALIGPNGAGKTSFLRTIYRKIIPDNGDIIFNNKELSQYSRRELAKKIAVVTQTPAPVFELSVLEVVRMGRTPHKSLFSSDSREDTYLIEQSLETVGLLSKASDAFDTLSGGEQQRALIARALVQQPDLLLMDEPTNHLDAHYQHQILSLTKRLGITVIASIHDLNLAASYCDRLVLIDHGRILAEGPPELVLTSEILPPIFNLSCLIDTDPFSHRPRVAFAPKGTR